MNLPTAYGTKEDGKPFVIHNPDLFRLSLNQLPEGHYKLPVEKCHRKASTKQFGYLYSVVYPLMLEALQQTGMDAFKTVDDVDMWCKWKWANTDVLDFELGCSIKLPMSKSQFKTVDEMAYCNKIREWCIDKLDLEIPDPDVNWKTKKRN